MSEPTAFPLDESKLPFKIPKDTKPREKIMKLGQMITDRVPAKLRRLTVEDPEYWGLASIVTDEMADVALKMKVRQPMTLPELEKATGKPAKELEPLLYQMSCVGLLEYNWENPRREKQYILPMFVPGSAEFFNMNKQQIADHPEVTAFFERMTFLPLEHITAMVPPGGAGIGMHVIPVEKAIETENHSLDIEHISHWLKKYQGKYAAGPCSCRMSRAAMGEGCGDDPDDWCIGVGDMADYLVETNKGHYVTYDEVMRILQKAEDNGFVHQITNIDGENKIFAICNCNVNVCNALRTSQLFNTPNMSRSAYVAKVEPQNCVACGRCVEFCPAGAVKLGQKLCTKNGPVQYPKQELPDTVKWGPEKWAVDYRDKNRINCYDTGTAPCKTACPAHIAVQGYLKMAAQGRYRDALALIKKENPFPAVCGRVCNKRCEEACTRGTIDQAVAIDAVKKFLAEQDLHAETRYIPPVVVASSRLTGWDQKIAIIGAGPAGMEAAVTLKQRGFDVVVFDKRDEIGGNLHVAKKPPFKGKFEWAIDYYKSMAKKLNITMKLGKEVTAQEVLALKPYSILVATGSNVISIPLEGLDQVQTVQAHDVLANDMQFANKKVVVIGGGITGLETALYINRQGTNQVSVVDMLPEWPVDMLDMRYQNEALLEVRHCNDQGVALFYNNKVVKFADGKLFIESTKDGEVKELPADVIVLSVGVKPNDALWQELLASGHPSVWKAGDAIATGKINKAVLHGSKFGYSLN